MANKIWIDVEDLFQYAAANPRPSGIQRIEYELCRALATLPESRQHVRFVRHSSTQRSFYSIPYAELDALYSGLTADKKPHDEAAPVAFIDQPQPKPFAKGPLRRLAYRIPSEVRTPILNFYRAEREAGRALVHIGTALRWASSTHLKRALGGTRTPAIVYGRARRAGQAGRPSTAAAPVPTAAEARSDGAVPVTSVAAFEATSAPGDILLVLGSPWFHPFYAEIIEKAQRQRGVRFSLLVYDLIPLRRPEWCDHNLVQRFREWTGDVFPLVDTFLTISRASARDIVQQAEASGYPLRSQPQPIPIGTGFSSPAKQPVAAAKRDRLPAPGSYALIVSTIEARKNHILLFRIWRRLLEEMPRDKIPTLVFAGRIGWLVSDLMQQLRNADFLDGKIMLVEDPSDQELERLYAGCQFTLFPSLYEGWGLPVTESLSFGRPCIISNATSLPEAGGHLARYFDPENAGEAYDVIRHAIETPDETEAWAAQVKREFKTVSWQDSARGVLRALNLPTLNDIEPEPEPEATSQELSVASAAGPAPEAASKPVSNPAGASSKPAPPKAKAAKRAVNKKAAAQPN